MCLSKWFIYIIKNIKKIMQDVYLSVNHSKYNMKSGFMCITDE